MTVYFDYAIMNADKGYCDNWGSLEYNVTKELYERMIQSYKTGSFKFLSDDKTLTDLTDALTEVFTSSNEPSALDSRFLIFAYPESIKNADPYVEIPPDYIIIEGSIRNNYILPEEIFNLMFNISEDDLPPDDSSPAID